MVGPQNLKPRPASSLEIFCDSAVSAGTCLTLRNVLTFGLPSTKPHSSRENPGPCSITSSQARAERTAPSIFMRLRTIPASALGRSIFLGVERAVVEFRHAPFLVVIGEVERILLRPRAARKAIGRCELYVHSTAFASP